MSRTDAWLGRTADGTNRLHLTLAGPFVAVPQERRGEDPVTWKQMVKADHGLPMAREEHYLKRELDASTRQQGALLGFLQTCVLDGLWYWDLENPEHEWQSPEFWRILGYDPTVKRHLAAERHALIHPEDLELAAANFRRHCDDASQPYDHIVRYHHHDGFTVWVRCRGLVIRREGKPIRMLGAHINVTEQQHALKVLSGLAERQRGELAAVRAELERERSALGQWSQAHTESRTSPPPHDPAPGPARSTDDHRKVQASLAEQYRRLFADTVMADSRTGVGQKKALAARIGDEGGRAADIVDFHLDVSRRTDALVLPQARRLRERSRVFALELMGHLVEYYRAKVLGAATNPGKKL